MTTIMTKAKGSEHPKLTKCFNDFVANMRRLAVDSNESELNRLELNGKKIGIITAGTPYYYAKEVLPDASFLKLGLVNPLPAKLIRITSYNVCYTKLLRAATVLPIRYKRFVGFHRITSYNVCYTKLLRP